MAWQPGWLECSFLSLQERLGSSQLFHPRFDLGDFGFLPAGIQLRKDSLACAVVF
jgi:hypothetical protein